MSKKILVFGSGLLGKAFERYLPNDFECRVISHSECDIMNIDNVRRVVSEYKPDFVINTAAISDVDYCETHPNEAFIINSGGAGYVASVARDFGVRVVHISTDYVFDGRKDTAYEEDEEPKPLSIYAKSKYEGEQLVRFSGAEYLILRVQWLFGEFRETFIDKAIKRLMNGEEVDVVTDQFGSPTYVKYVVYATAMLLDKGCKGIFHIASQGICSRYEQMMFVCDTLGLKVSLLKPKIWSEFPNAAKRPKKIELSKEKLLSMTGFVMPHWKDQTDEYIKYKYRSKK